MRQLKTYFQHDQRYVKHLNTLLHNILAYMTGLGEDRFRIKIKLSTFIYSDAT